MSTVTLGGNPVKLGGNFLKPGDNAPQFSLTEIKNQPDYDAALVSLK